MAHRLDHLVYAVPDLIAGVAEFAERTGVEPAPGGRHIGRGTANYLIGLGHGGYLEIIGPDPESSDPPALFGLDEPGPPRLVTWAVRTSDLDAAIASARGAGYDPGPSTELSRRAGDSVLQWRLTGAAGIRPFLIDWGSSSHPSESGLPVVSLVDFVVLATDPPRVRMDLAALDSSVPVEAGAVDGLRARLATPRGAVTLRS